MNRQTKQVIVIRKDLNMRKGKIAAQASHASMAFLTRQYEAAHRLTVARNARIIAPSDVQVEWLNNSFTKICVSVDSEEELYEIEQRAKAADIECHLIIDNGHTEFHGVSTPTCLALGPDYSDRIDAISGGLPLL
jgi:PTH2 family peptidyl-tRNA hydrolase